MTGLGLIIVGLGSTPSALFRSFLKNNGEKEALNQGVTLYFSQKRRNWRN